MQTCLSFTHLPHFYILTTASIRSPCLDRSFDIKRCLLHNRNHYRYIDSGAINLYYCSCSQRIADSMKLSSIINDRGFQSDRREIHWHGRVVSWVLSSSSFLRLGRGLRSLDTSICGKEILPSDVCQSVTNVHLLFCVAQLLNKGLKRTFW